MEIVTIHQTKTHLSRLLEKVMKGEPFLIAKAGKPIAKVIPFEEPKREPRNLGFPAHVHIVIPDNFDRWAEDEITEMFGVKE